MPSFACRQRGSEAGRRAGRGLSARWATRVAELVRRGARVARAARAWARQTSGTEGKEPAST